jgi:hypothetical protein
MLQMATPRAAAGVAKPAGLPQKPGNARCSMSGAVLFCCIFVLL